MRWMYWTTGPLSLDGSPARNVIHKYTCYCLEAIHPSEIFNVSLEIHTININEAWDPVKWFTPASVPTLLCSFTECYVQLWTWLNKNHIRSLMKILNKYVLFRPLTTGFVKDVARPDYWVPDQDITQCHKCSKTFTSAMSKHHCRACGQGVCGPCSTHIRPVPSRGWDHPVRVCDSCHARTDSLWAFSTGRTSQSALVLPQMAHRKHCQSWHCCSKRTQRIHHTALNGRTGWFCVKRHDVLKLGSSVLTSDQLSISSAFLDQLFLQQVLRYQSNCSKNQLESSTWF